MLMYVKFFVLMFVCYLILLSDGYDEILEFNIILDLKKILFLENFVESFSFVLGIFINVFRLKVIM